MKSTQLLLERRAERGTPSGAANVWASVQVESSAEVKRVKSGSLWMSRAALLAWTMAVGILGLIAVTTDDADANRTVPAQPDDVPLVSSEPLPNPILVEGMSLRRVVRPFDPDFDGDDILNDSYITRETESFPSRAPDQSTVVFADASNPFNNPIIGLSLANGGFRPWSANVDQSELDGLLDQVVRVDGEWTMLEESGLVVVARFGGDLYDNLERGWQFDFVAGSDEIILQAETSKDGTSADEWLWVTRLAQEGFVGSKVREVEVLGQTGIAINLSDRPTDEVVWATDGFVYRLTATTLNGDLYDDQKATSELFRLLQVDRRAWVDAVNKVNQTPTSAGIVAILAAVILIGAVFNIVALVVKRRFVAAGTLGLVLAALMAGGFTFLSSGTPIWLLAGGALLIGIVFWQSQRQAFS